MSKEQNIYKMKLNETIGFKHFSVLRVPGGWVYVIFDVDGNLKSSTFVPFDHEFQSEMVLSDDR